jgi:hypothetical protein
MGLRLTRADPKLAAAVSKATTDMRSGASHNQFGNRNAGFNEFYAFFSALQRRAQRNNDSQAVMRMLPDVELAKQILVSCILAPKDMMSTELIYSVGAEDFQSDLATSLIDRLKDHFTTDYPVIKNLADMIGEALFEKGSYPVAVLPENAIDQLINGKRGVSMEALDKFYNSDGSAKSVGMLGSGRDKPNEANGARFGVSLEHFNRDATALSHADCLLQYNDADFSKGFEDFKEYVFITDNPAALKTSKLMDTLKTKHVGKVMSVAMESEKIRQVTQVPDRAIERAIFKNRPGQNQHVSEVPSQMETERNSVGNPMVMKLPSEAVIPVHVPGDPSRHIGYYVILDENGNAVYAPESDLLNPGQQNSGQSGSAAQSAIVQRAALNMGMVDANKFDMNNHLHMQAAVRVYGDMVERDLINRVRHGALGVHSQVARNEEVYRLMLSRTLAKRFTQVLYIPVEYMTYIAFKYGADGLGRSLLDEQSMLNMLRATLLFAEVIGGLKNSIGRTRVTGNIPEEDPDPMATIEKVVHEIVQSRRLNIPMGISNPADLMNFVQQAGFEFDWSGNLGIPNLKLSFEQIASQYQSPIRI